MAFLDKTTPPIQLVTRGRGKIFALLDGLPEGCLCRACLPDGALVPSQLIAGPEGKPVLAVAVLSCDQQVSICSSEGKALASFTLREDQAALASKANTLARKHEADAIRNIDVDALDASIQVDHLIGAFEERIVRGRVTLWGIDEPDAQRDMDILVLTGDGRSVSEAWTSVGGGVFLPASYPGIVKRTLDFSVRIPDSLGSFFVWARYADSKETVAFEWLDAGAVGAMRRKWDDGHVAAFFDGRYHDWFVACHRSDERDLGLQRMAQKHLAKRPLFSLVVPLYRTPLSFFREMADSVLGQTYDNLELILVNASPDNVELAAEIERYRGKDARVRCVTLDANRGIAANTNEGIRVAEGDFIAFVDHDDVVEPDLLYWYAKAVSDYPTTDMLYCDEDKLEGGRYVFPDFKPDWDPEFLCSANYVCHMLAVRASVVSDLGGLGREVDGSQDHDLAFLAGERARNVFHVRRVLYHWRIHEGSTAGDITGEQKAYAREAQRRVVQAHLDRCGLNATARMGYRAPGRVIPERCYVDFALPEPQPLVSIIIPSHEAADVLRACVESIFERTTWKNYEIIVVENGSVLDETFKLYDELEDHGNVQVVECAQPDGFNFSRLVNCGVAASRGEYLMLLNNDTEVRTPDWIELMMGPMGDPAMGCVGAKLLYPDGTVQHVGVSMGRSYGPYHIDPMKPSDDPCCYETAVLPHQVSAVTGACVLVRRALFDELGGMDEEFPIDFNDIDFCMRARARGYKNLIQPYAVLLHHESVSRGAEKNPVKWQSLMGATGRFHARWGRYLSYGDPFYSKNFLFNDPYHRLDV